MKSVFLTLFITPAQAAQGVKKEKKRLHIFFLSSLGARKEPSFFFLLLMAIPPAFVS